MTGHSNGVNGVARARALTPGIYAPIPTFFKPETEDLGVSWGYTLCESEA